MSRFTTASARLARIPPPRLGPVDLGPLLRRVTGLETRLPVRLRPGPDVRLQADPDQLEQVLINLVRNGVDAALETSGGVEVGWSIAAQAPEKLEVWVVDEGPG